MKQSLLATVLALAFGVASAEPLKAVTADSITTATAISNGATEMNPLGFATLPIRLVLVEQARQMSREDGQPIEDAIEATSWGAAASNSLVLMNVSAAAPIVGIIVGYTIWKEGEERREFWHLCAVHKQMDPTIVKCTFKEWKSKDGKLEPPEESRESPEPSELQGPRFESSHDGG